LQLLTERSEAAEDAEKEGAMIAICDLADDLRDVVVEYQVSPDIQKHALNGHSCSSQFSQQKAIYDQNCKLIVSRGVLT